MTVPETPADLGQALEEAELLLPAAVVFGLLPLAGLAGTGALQAAFRPPAQFFVDLVVHFLSRIG